MPMTRNRILWLVQWLLALLFLFAGVMKLVLPIEEMAKQIALPGAVVLTFQTGGFGPALFPSITGLLLALVIYRRRLSVAG
jgi:hypothetical protein